MMLPLLALPARHLKAYYGLALVFNQLNIKNINLFPWTNAWMSCCVTLDTKILLQNIIGEQWPFREGVHYYRQIWHHVVDLNQPVFKNQRRNLWLTFHCMELTESADVSVLKSSLK